MYLGYAFDHGVVLVTTDRCGVIALLPPDVPEPDGQFQAEAAALHGDRLAAVARADSLRAEQKQRRDAGDRVQLGLGIWLYHEPFPAQKQIGYALIWISLAIYATEGVLVSRLGPKRVIDVKNEAA